MVGTVHSVTDMRPVYNRAFTTNSIAVSHGVTGTGGYPAVEGKDLRDCSRKERHG
jgi:hypothetical protein